MLRRSLLLCMPFLTVWATSSLAAEYSGPRPPKPDVPYLVHADNLVETEAQEAREESGRNRTTFMIGGEHSQVRTPLAEPIFLLWAKEIEPEQIEAFAMEIKGAHREVVFRENRDDGPRSLRLSVERLADELYRIEAQETFDNGEYCLSPSGTNKSFCFQVY